MQRKLLGIISADFKATGQLLIIYSAFVKYLRKEGNTIKQCLIYFVGFKKVYDSVRQEVMYNILNEFGIPMKMVRLIKMRLNKTYRKVKTGKHLCDMLPVKDALKQDA
jgi:hypothetical protein